MRERRQHKRVAARMRVGIFDALGHIKPAQCRNISAGGLGVEADFSLPIGTVIGVTFSLPSGEAFKTIELKGRVVDTVYRGVVGKYAMGISFINVNSEISELLYEYVRVRVAI